MKLVVVLVAALLVYTTEGILFGGHCKTDSECYSGEGCCEIHFLGLGNKCRHKVVEFGQCQPTGNTCETQCQKGLDCVDEAKFDIALEPQKGSGFRCMSSTAASSPATVNINVK